MVGVGIMGECGRDFLTDVQDDSYMGVQSHKTIHGVYCFEKQESGT